ncbi:MAG: DinB family protein [Nitrospinae bacterium]|nr:DinB family protein [Nitrospinota bacterium]
MSGFPDFPLLFKYNLAAHRAALASLPDDSTDHERAYRIYGHMVSVERLWLSRIAEGERAVAPEMFPLLSRGRLAEAVEENVADTMALLADPTEGDPDRMVSFVTTDGMRLSSTVGGILFHVINHGSYHRGQVASLVAKGGGKAAATDYLLFDVGRL